ncbi:MULTISPECIES: methyl-accepting chemotaxis protein [Paenibacillus]|uniref:methyl-accepting chemotaxis protein n=1 Tax=Paenibacillus TaxID=44249 RepID=UPI0022B8E068|nr:methyl-accepting chemotaxis protein [Paenibacillus caseinilyticus]MCZ8519496.1 methyl-accepting chemotaxis protein [Paenibacillus caseinilyticus]
MKLLRNLGIMKKLMILISISVLALGSVGFLGEYYIRKMAMNSEIMYKDNLIPLGKIMQIRVNARASDAYTLELLTSKDPERIKELKDEIASAWEEIDGMIEEIQHGVLTDEQQQFLNQYKIHAKTLSENRSKVISLIGENKIDEAYSLYLEVVETNRKSVNDTLKGLQHANLDNAGIINVNNQENVHSTSLYIISITCIALVVLMGLGLLIARMIVKPVREVKQLLLEAENGDFTVKGSYDSKDEIGELTTSFNHMTASLQSVFSTVQASSHLVASSSEELSASAAQNSKASEHITLTVQELAAGTETQVEKVEHSSEAISEMTGYTKTIADNTEKMRKDVLHASLVSTEGNKAILEVSEQMNSINANVNGLFEAVKNLNERSNEIEQITNVISGISAQTNLLALNAAIEAARAGEHGQGFAVVANEVRKLAEQSNKSTEQISQLIQLIQKDTDHTLQTMQKASEEVQAGLTVVNSAGDSFHKINHAVSGVVSQIEDISVALQRLASETEHVNSSIIEVSSIAKESASNSQNISAATQEQLASMEEISASSQALANLADELQAIMSRFKI